jgi:hypothetical protein
MDRRGGTPAEQKRRAEADFLAYRNEDGLYADFHSNRHLFITSLEYAGLSPKMAQTLARDSDVRLTLGVYTHVGLCDQTAAIESLPAPPRLRTGSVDDAEELVATGTDGANDHGNAPQATDREVPMVVPTGAENGAVLPASPRRRIAPSCTGKPRKRNENDVPRLATTPGGFGRFSTTRDQSASQCIEMEGEALESTGNIPDRSRTCNLWLRRPEVCRWDFREKD